MEFLNKIVKQFIRANRKLKRWQRGVSILAAVVVFATTYAFVLPAITLDKETASEQSGIEIAASDNELGGDGTVYEAEPEEPAEEINEEESENSQEEESDGPEENESEGPQDAEAVAEDSGSQSGSHDAEVSEEDNSDEDTEAAGGHDTEKQAESEEAEKPSDDEDVAPDTSEDDAAADPAALTDETLTEGESAEEIKLITEKTQLVYEYVDEEYENGIDDENDDGIDDGYFVYAEFGADAKLPEGVELIAEEITKDSDPEAYEAYYEKALSGLQDKYDENTTLSFARFYDITFVYNGKEVEPSGDVKVRIEYKKAVEIEKDTNVDAVHFDKNNDGEPEVIESEVNKSEPTAEKKDEDNIVKTVEFESDQFSVYGVIGSYTVDFHWEVNGKTYEYSIPGGGYASFYDLVEILGIAADDADTATDEIQELVDGVESIEFSDPELVSVSRVEEDTTVGAVKNSLGLECEYSAEMTDDMVAEIDAQKVRSGDWVLISLKPFAGEETLKITMKNGDQWTVMVTEAQLDKFVLSASDETYKIIVSYGKEAEIPLGTELTVEEIKESEDPKAFIALYGRAWQEVNKEFLATLEQRLRFEDYMEPVPETGMINLEAVRFFNISLVKDGEIVEPAAPVKVWFGNKAGMTSANPEKNIAGVVHVTGDDTVELITEVKTDTDEDGEVVSFEYLQSGFSATGYYVGEETHDLEGETYNARALSFGENGGKKSMLRAARGLRAAGDDGVDEYWIEGDEVGKFYSRKLLEDNYDGTFKLDLSVKGVGSSSSVTTVTKTNVLIVMDRSSSMVNNNVYQEYNGPYDASGQYYGVIDGRHIPVTRYGNTWYTSEGGWQQYNGPIFIHTDNSRLVEEQAALRSLITALTGMNRDETIDGVSLSDLIEVSLISFSDRRSDLRNTDATGNWATLTETGWETEPTDLVNAANRTESSRGTNWEEALMYAKDKADAKRQEPGQENEPMFVIFLTDGEPTNVNNVSEHDGWAHHYIADDGSVVGEGFEAAYTPSKDDAAALVNAGYNFYGIFTYGEGSAQTRYLKRLINHAYGHNDDDTNTEDLQKYFTDASTTDVLMDAFQNIISSINDTMQFDSVQFTDGVGIDATATAVINGKAQGYKYVVKGEVGELYSVTTSGTEADPVVKFTIGGTEYDGTPVTVVEGGSAKTYYSCTVDGKEYKMALASINEQGLVTWDLSSIGKLLNGYTYTAEFNVWPNQEAYDYVAHLNNGDEGYSWDINLPTYKDLTNTKGYEVGGADGYPSIVKWPSGRFSVLTNTEQKVEYDVVTTHTVNGVTTEERVPHEDPLDPPDPMPLVKTDMNVEKKWEHGLDPKQFVELLYDNDLNPKGYTVDLYLWKADTQAALEQLVEASKSVPDDQVTGYYKKMTVGWDSDQGKYIWTHDFTVAPGMMVTLSHATDNMRLEIDENNIYTYTHTETVPGEGGSETEQEVTEYYYVLDPGHYYTLSEPNVDRHYELNAVIYHPMVVDGELKQVTFEGNTVKEVVPMSQLTGENVLKGGINVQKKVYDTADHEINVNNDTFSVTLEMINSDGSPYTDFDYRIYYGENNPNYQDTATYPEHRTGHVFGTQEAAVLSENGNPESSGNEPGETQMKVLGNTDGKVTISLYVGDTIRVINVPAGVKYTVTENDVGQDGYIDGTAYHFEGIDYEISVGTATNHKPAEPDKDGWYVVKGNSSCLATVKNKVPSSEVNLLKKTAGTSEIKPMAGVQFKLYYDEPCTKQVLTDSLGNTIGVDIYPDEDEQEGDPEDIEPLHRAVLITDDDGTIVLGSFIAGTYYLKEISTWEGYILLTEPVSVTIREDGSVSYYQKDYSPSESSVPEQNTDGSYTVTVANNPGVELPNAGGPGSGFFTILGSILITGAGLLLWRRKKIV